MREEDELPDQHGELTEAQRAAVDLLDALALTPDANPTAFARARRERDRLQEWFGTRAGWQLQSTPAFTRLIKTPDRPTAAMGAPTERPLTAREYALIA